uniref:cytochrome c oxidase subunit III n=1 Tax=Ooencyrtus plautus TaxID=2989845 RepID=UPI0022373B26|nr:cytochrome c oxidase subunit III [Ooencyrtus plautus]UYP50990.1 cytochrome c oxidase subunit III [Ooencyrtus plautus]
MKKLFQPFHLVTFSPWPILMSFSIMNLLLSVIFWFNFKFFLYLLINMLILLMCMYQWWRDVIREGFLQGFHTFKVIKGLKIGMILFIISEIFFFISIFWCYFHMFLSPSIEIGSLWPPKNIKLFNPYSIPLLNTVILLSSGVSVTWCHYSLINSNFKDSLLSMMITIILGLIFSLFQLMEYKESTFTFSDSVYGSIFFMSTGFHGFHVLVGTIFLMVNYLRILNLNFSKIHHFGFEAACWYWHFVDVVWMFLYILVYFWLF